jgi:hypothetical protein
MDNFPFIYCGLIIPNYLLFIQGSLLYPRRIPWYFGREIQETIWNEVHSRDGTFLDVIEFNTEMFISKDGENTFSSRWCLYISVLSSSDDEDIAPERINPIQTVNNTFEPRPTGHPQGIRASSKDADLIPPPRPTSPAQTPSIQKREQQRLLQRVETTPLHVDSVPSWYGDGSRFLNSSFNIIRHRSIWAIRRYSLLGVVQSSPKLVPEAMEIPISCKNDQKYEMQGQRYWGIFPLPLSSRKIQL